MKCDRYHSLLMQHFDRKLEGPQRELLDRHLLSCPRCRALRDDLVGILGTLENVAPMEPEPQLEGLVLGRIMSLPNQGDRGRKTSQSVVYGTLAGLAALLFLTVGLSVQNMGYLDLLLAGRDYVYWFSMVLVVLQTAYGIASGLLPVDLSAAFREIQTVSVLAMLMLVIMTVRAVFARLTGENPDTQ
jgi:predicted anti-sigma-YlaC factor YlaD